MAKGHAQLALLSRTACRALMSGTAPLVSEASSSLPMALNRATGEPFAVEGAPSTSYREDDAAGCAQQRVVPAPFRTGFAGLMSSSTSPRHFLPVAFPPRGVAIAGPATWAPAGASPPLTLLRAQHVSSGAAAAAEGDSIGGGGGGTTGPQHQHQPQGPGAAPVQNPLQAALLAAAAAGGRGGSAAAERQEGLAGVSRVVAGGRRRERFWMWYDEQDERNERLKERQREQYGDSGTVYLMDVPQSMKKMNRILRLIRGLPYSEAVAQCKLVPQKAAKYVVQALEAALEDATEKKGLNSERLVVGTIFVTKGQYEKGMQPMGKGGSGRKYARRSHLRVALREMRGRPAAFQARRVTPLMGVMTSSASSAWLARGPGAAGQQRQRFAYRVEV